MDYIVKSGDTIGDVVLNTTGLITNWEAILNENDMDSWTPDLSGGEIVKIPDVIANDLEAVRAMKMYPVCNSSSDIIYGLIGEIFQKLLNVPEVTAPDITTSLSDTNRYYKVGYGETIVDVVLNSSGNIDNWEAILEQNDFDWIPQLVAGQLVAIPPGVKDDLNAFRALTQYPANNNSENDIYGKIDAIFDILNVTPDKWILFTDFWRDIGIWIDTSHWQD